MAPQTQHIPVVDMGTLGLGSSSSSEDTDRVATEIHQAFHDIGFLYLKNHGIPKNKVEAVFQESEKLFSLPQQTKLKTKRTPTHIQGYSEPAQERLDDSDKKEIRETYDIVSMDDVFPDELPTLKPSIHEFLLCARELTTILLQLLGRCVGQTDFFLNLHQHLLERGNSSTLRLLHYPPLNKTDDKSLRCGSHTDYGTMTLLFQHRIGGLKVRSRSGEWVSAEPIPGTILVNIGDLTEMWTGGEFIATEHMVPMPTDQSLLSVSRYSMALFIHPDDEVVVSPVIGSKDKYPTVNAFQYYIDKYKETYAE